ncbi:MAG: glycosyltransferase family 4 protein [Candidatus Nanohaloarchaea archaeon]
MRILLVGWGFPPEIDGGLDIHVRHLFEELENRGIEVKLALPEERAPERESIVPIETGDGDMVQKARKMSQEIADLSSDFDIIHTHDWFGSESGFKTRKYNGVIWVHTFHSLSSSRSRNPDERIEKMERAAAESSDGLIAVSQRLAEQVEENYGRGPRMIHNGFSKPPESGKDVRDALDIEGEMILFVGRHAEQKGVEHLIYGFNKLLREKDATLVVGGEGHMKESLEKFVDILDIEDSVVFTGFIPREELGDYYREADVFVSPSIEEPFGLTITEALESGTPVVATGSGVEEIAGDSIFRIEPDSDSIKQGVEKALESEVPVHEQRSWKEMADEVIETYENLA